MELQNFIQNNDYINEFKNLKLNTRKYSKLGLLIVKIYHNQKYDYDTYPWIKYCRGAVININNNKLVCIPPIDSVKKENLSQIIEEYNPSYLYQPLVDGTMINMFYHNNEWFISTRSNIGAKNSWDGKISFNKMFEEIVGNDFSSMLDKCCCYSFVMQHTKNRIVTPIEKNKVYLVEKHKMGDNIETCVDFEDINNVENIFSFDSTYLSNYLNNLYYSIKGFTIKGKNERYKWINPNYMYVHDIKMNNNNKFLNYMDLRHQWLLNEYLLYFPEEREIFNKYRDKIKYVKDLLYSSYVRYKIKKEIDIKNIEYCLRPLVGELHDFYKKTNIKITQKYVSSYVNKLDGKRLIFIINNITESKV